VVVTIINERRGKSPYKRGAKREDETLITGTTYLPRALPNGLQGTRVKLRLRAAGMDDEIFTGKSNI
jgi:hypothetical protein